MIPAKIVVQDAKALDVSSAVITLDQQRGSLKMVVRLESIACFRTNC